MGAKRKGKKAAVAKSGQGVVKTKGKPGSKRVVVTAPKPKKPKAKKRKRAKSSLKAKPVTPPKSTAIPKVSNPNNKPIVVMEPPPDEP